MKKSEIFEKVMTVVSGCTEVEVNDILSKCRKAEIIDARCMVVHFCREKHLTINYLMHKFGIKSHSSICNLSKGFSNKYKNDRYFRSISSEVSRKVADIQCENSL